MPLPSLDIDGILSLFVFIVPGFVAYQALSLLMPRQQERGKDFVLTFLALSALNFGVNFWVPPLVNNPQSPEWIRYALWAWFVLPCPLILGFLIGIGFQKDWIGKALASRLFAWIKLRPIHHIPTAWDWKFSRIQGEWVLLTLKDGTQFGGFCGSESFIASHLVQRDIYIERVFSIEAEGWQPTNRSLYVAAGEIRTVEFIKPEEVEQNDEPV